MGRVWLRADTAGGNDATKGEGGEGDRGLFAGCHGGSTSPDSPIPLRRWLPPPPPLSRVGRRDGLPRRKR